MGQLAQRSVPVCYYGLQGSTVEIDFVVQEPSMIVSIEVMPHQNGNSKALKLFCERNPGRKGIRTSLDNHFDRLWMENVPAYTVGDYLDVVLPLDVCELRELAALLTLAFERVAVALNMAAADVYLACFDEAVLLCVVSCGVVLVEELLYCLGAHFSLEIVAVLLNV